MKTLSLKLDDFVFQETEQLLERIKTPRNRYINEALKFYRYQYMLWNFLPIRNAPTALIVEPLQKAMTQVIKRNIMLVRVTIEQAVITDNRLIGEGYRARQLWRRR